MTPTTTTACIACRLPPKDPNAPSGNLVRDDNISANYAYVFLRISVQRIGFVYSQPAQTHLTTSCQDRRKSSLPRQELVGPDPAHNILPRQEEMLSAKTAASGPKPSSQYPAKTGGSAPVLPAKTGGNALCQVRS